MQRRQRRSPASLVLISAMCVAVAVPWLVAATGEGGGPSTTAAAASQAESAAADAAAQAARNATSGSGGGSGGDSASGSSVPWTPDSSGSGAGAPAHNPLQQLLLRISGSVSAAGSLFIIVSFGYFPESRKFSRKILVYMSVADFFSSLAFVWSSTIESPLDAPTASCVAQGFVLQFFYLASYLWTSCFAFHLFQLIWKKNPTSERYELYYHILSWGVPAALCAYFFVKFLMGEASMGFVERPWCWIRNVDTGTAWSWTGSLEQFLFFYLPVAITLVYNLMVYVFLARVVGQVLSASMESKIRKRLIMYLLVFVICAVWGFINRTYQAFADQHAQSETLTTLECVMGPLQGALNALVYGMNEKLRDRYLSCCFGGSTRRRGEKGAGLLRPSSPSTDREQFYPHSPGRRGSGEGPRRNDSFASVGSRASEPNAVAM